MTTKIETSGSGTDLGRAFQIDTSGSVEAIGQAINLSKGDTLSPGPGQVSGWRVWSDLDPFTQGYIEALFASIPGAFSGLITSDSDLSFSDLAPETLGKIIGDCARAITHGSVLTSRNSEVGGGSFLRLRQLGAYPEMFPPLTVTLGDDGKVYLS